MLISQIRKFFINNNHQKIVNSLMGKNLNNLKSEDRNDLIYWLANALFYSKEYSKAKELISQEMIKNKNDQLCLLLAMIYESEGLYKEARNEYLTIINEFPQSDYYLSAKIKMRILHN